MQGRVAVKATERPKTIIMGYTASDTRYDSMQYRRAGRSGVDLPAISFGLWQNFGDDASQKTIEEILFKAFDNGINYFDLANNYGPAPGSAETNFGKVLAKDFKPYRDELIIASKAGYTMWDGPYGDWGSRKYLVSSCDQSLRRMGLEYVDIFYSHRYDPRTPIEETMGALDYIVRSGRALYAGISNYPAEHAAKAIDILDKLGTPCLVHQIKYSMIEHEMGDSLFDLHRKEGVGCVAFSPLAQGLLSDKYLDGIPEGSRAAKDDSLTRHYVKDNLEKVKKLNMIAVRRGQTLAQMAIAWQLYDDRITSVLVGASSVTQLMENISAQKNTRFAQEEIAEINSIIL